MTFVNHARNRVRRLCILLLAMALLEGCSQSHPLDDSRERQFTGAQKYELREAVAKFAGRVTVDGKPPKKNCRLFVILNDARHLDETAEGRSPELYATCDRNGYFAFKTYDIRDGVRTGKFVVTFVELHPAVSYHGPHFVHLTNVGNGGPENYFQPDELKNLYNDPEKNAKDPNFNLELEPPGQVGYRFDLVVAGKKAIEKPGPKAVTGLPRDR